MSDFGTGPDAVLSMRITMSRTWMLAFSMAVMNQAVRSLGTQPDRYGGKILNGVCSFSVVPGFFLQSDPTFPTEGYDLLIDRFGLVDRSPEGWRRLTE